MADAKMPEPMGGGIPEESTGQADELLNRNCWAIDVLIEEVTALFKTGVETREPNWLNANMVVIFTPEEGEWDDMSIVMQSLEDDERVQILSINEEDGEIYIQIVSNAILYDTRDSFGLADAVVGLDRQITPDDFTPLAADLALGGEGFTEGSL